MLPVPPRNKLPDPSAEPTKQYADGIKWFAGMSTLLVVGSASMFDKLSEVLYRYFLFGVVVVEVLSMVFAGFALFLNAHHYYAQTDHGEKDIDVNKIKPALTRIVLWQFGTMILGFILALISFWGLVDRSVTIIR